MPLQPKVFVGSAREHVRLLKRLNVLNDHSRVRYVPWTNLGIFEPGEYTMQSLRRSFDEVDGAAFFFLGTDTTWWRDERAATPRDNVVFEAGIAVGAFGLSRTAIITNEETRLPSDLAGLNTIRLRLSGDEDMDLSDLHAKLERFFGGLSAGDQELRQFWDKDSYSVYFHSFDNPEPGEFEEIVNVSAVRAMGRLTDYFSHAGIEYSLHSSRSQDLLLDRDLVLLGSSASNRITKHLGEECGIELPFACTFDPASMGERRVVSAISGEDYPTRFNADAVMRDVGILTKIANPYRSDAWVTMAAGNYGFGTLGAILFALDAQQLSDMPVSPSVACQAIIEVPVFGTLTVGEPKLLESACLEDGATHADI